MNKTGLTDFGVLYLILLAFIIGLAIGLIIADEHKVVGVPVKPPKPNRPMIGGQEF